MKTWQMVSHLMCVAAAAMAAISLSGWTLGNRILVGVFPASFPIHPFTALLLPVGALSVWLCGGTGSYRKTVAGFICACTLTLAGLVRLAGYWIGAGSSAEEFLFPVAFRKISIEVAPIVLHIAPNTSIPFVLIGGALLIIHSRLGRLQLLAFVLALGSSLVAMLSISDSFINVASLSAIFSNVPMGAGTAVAILFLATGVFIELADTTWQMEDGDAAHFTGQSPLRRSLEYKVAAGFGGALLTLCVGGIISYQSISQFITDSRWDNHTYQVLASILGLRAELNEIAVAGQRYIITGDPHFLDPWRAGLDRVEPSLNSLRVLTEDNPAQQQRIARLEPLLERKLVFFKTFVKTRRDYGIDRARTLLSTEDGPSLTGVIDAALGNMEADENSLLIRRINVTESNAHRSIVLVSGGAVFSLILVSIAAWMIRRGIAARVLANDVLLARKAQLEIVDVQLKKARDEAETANRHKSEFLANMSHEIRTPMTAIIGFSDMMLQNDPRTPDHSECIQVIRRNAAHLLELINEILDLSKIEAGELKINRSRCDLPRLLAEVSAFMRTRAAESSLTLTVSFEGRIPQYISTDVLRLRQVLVNLLGNAIKFTASGGVRMIVSCDNTAASSVLRIDVRDTGIGMSADQLGRIFNPFVQGEESTTRKYGGTGLGLTISRRMARLLGGDIGVKSTIGVGSDFAVWIDAGPLKETHMVTSLTEAALPAVFAEPELLEIPIRGHILLVEDGHDNQLFLSTHLKMAGANVTIADNGQIAVGLCASEVFDLILMDMQMPVMDGYSATKELRRRGIVAPIIALTAYAMSDDRDKCIASGCTDFLTKPIERQTLLQTIQFQLGQRAGAAIRPPNPQKNVEISGSIKSSVARDPALAGILKDFIRNLPTRVRNLQAFLDKKEMDSLRVLVHQLRGAGGSFGFLSITELAGAAEGAIDAQEAGEIISARIESLIQNIRRVEGYDRRSESIAA